MVDKRFYNESSAHRLGWEPIWFGADGFGSDLVEKVIDYQKSNGLTADGLVGPTTYRRIYTEVEAKLELLKMSAQSEDDSYIICGGERVPIEWDKTVALQDDDNMALPNKCYRTAPPNRNPTLIVTHWDAALSAKSCKNILQRRGISSHFVIDNDGTIYQLVDTNNIAWHAKGSNNNSIGIDFSNAYYTKYQRVYRKRGFGNRPILNSKIHGGKTGDHLGYYPVQLEAYKALIKVLCEKYNIPLECPMKDGKLLTGVHTPSQRGKFEGVVCHYHLNRKKIDCAGLELDVLLEDIKTT